MFYTNRRVLVTGGLGFIGSNLTIRLVDLGADVTVVDASIPGCGANPHNLASVRNRVRVIHSDIGDASRFQDELARAEVIFNLAGEVSHTHSMLFPERDLAINTTAHLRFLDACRHLAPGVRIVYASTRQVYGRAGQLPVGEEDPIRPVDFNGVHKYTTTMYHLMLSRTGELDAVCLRLTNVYGPRLAINMPCQGFLSCFLRCALVGEPVVVFGSGEQLRDPLYVDDAVEAFLLAGSVPVLPSRVYNVGGPSALTLNEIARVYAEAAGIPVRHRPFPADRKAFDIGSYASDSSRIAAELGWTPEALFEDGIRRTLDYFRAEFGHYLNPADPQARCTLPDHRPSQSRLLVTV